MGWNDRLDDWTETNLPDEAIGNTGSTLEIDDEWLQTATEDHQKQALKAWFLARYCDPAQETPYMSSEGGYIYIHGGPYDPDEVIQERFNGVVPHEIIESVVQEMYQQVGGDWAPIHWDEDDYDDEFGVEVVDPKQPIEVLERRLEEIGQVLTLTGTEAAQILVQKFAFSGVITALESFLWETMTYAVEHDDKTLEKIVTKIDHFSTKGMKLGEIFAIQKGLKDQVKAYLQDTVWHKWDKVGPMIIHGLRVKPPSFKPFVDYIVKRHDIVHRSGFTKDGVPITVDAAEIEGLIETVRNFAFELELRIGERDLKEASEEINDLIEQSEGLPGTHAAPGGHEASL
jgi:hypothetical protein